MNEDSSARFERLNDLADEIAQRIRRGEKPSLQEYLDRHPELSAEMRDLFPALVEVEQVRGDLHQSETVPLELTQLGDYRIVRKIGEGGMGVVYEAEQVSLGRRVALKVLSPRLLDNSRCRERFEREARSAGKLHHSNIVPVFAVGEHQGTPYYAMQYIDGHPLDAVLRELCQATADKSASPPQRQILTGPNALARSLIGGKFSDAGLTGPSFPNPDPREQLTEPAIQQAVLSSPPSLAEPSNPSITLLSQHGSPGRRPRQGGYWHGVASVGLQVGNALEYAHKQGVLHRDIKPANLLLDRRGTVWVTDFGLAKMDNQENLTDTGDLLGTLRYLSPESFRGQADRRSDVHALGLTLFELLALRPAYEASTRAGLMRQAMSGEVPRLDQLNPAVPRDLATIVHKATQPEPADRYPTAGEMADDLQRYLNDEPIRARRMTGYERLLRWAQRNRAVAWSLSAVAILLLTLTLLSLLATAYALQQQEVQRWLAEDSESQRQAADVAREKAQQALQEAQAAGSRLRRTLYVSEMNRLGQEVNSPGGLSRVRETLDRWRPKDGKDQRGWEWYFLRGLDQSSRLTLAASRQFLWTGDWSPDGTLLATGGADGVVRLWDPVRGKELPPLGTHLGGVLDLAWSPDSRRLASTSNDRRLVVWDVHGNRQPVLTIWTGIGTAQQLAWRPDGGLLAAGGEDSQIHLWSIPQSREKSASGWLAVSSSQKPAHHIAGPVNGGISALAWSSDGQTLAFSIHSTNPLIYLAEAAQGYKITRNLKAPLWGNTTLAWKPGAGMLAATGGTGLVRIYDLKSSQTRELAGHVGSATALAWSPDGRSLASAGEDRSVRIWDTAAGHERMQLRGHTGTVRFSCWSPCGRFLASGGDDGQIRLWAIEEAASPAEYRAAPAALEAANHVVSLAWQPGGRHLASATFHSCQVWDTLRKGKVADVAGGICVAWSPDGRRLALDTGGWTFQIFDLATRALRPLGNRHEHTICMAWHPKEQIVAVGSWSPTILLYDPDGRLAVREVPAGCNDVQSLAWSPDGRLLARGGSIGAILVGQVTGTASNLRLVGHRSEIRSLAWSPDGKLLASASKDQTIRIWDPFTGKQKGQLAGHTGTVQALSWHPTGKLLASGGDDQTIRLWEADTGIELLTLRGRDRPVQSLAWSPDGLRLASGGRDGLVLVYDAVPGYAAEGSPALLPFLDRLLSDSPKDATLRRLRGEVLSANRRWSEAEEDWRSLVADPRRYHPESAWWLAGPFPAEAEPPDPEGLAWRLTRATHNGYIDPGVHLPRGHTGCAYALARVWSPCEQSVEVELAASGPVSIWLGQQKQLELTSPPQAGSPPRRLLLKAGWNSVVFRLIGSPRTEPFLRVWLAEKPAGRSFQ